MNGVHQYKATIKWTGNKGTGTDNYKNYEKSHNICIENKTDILGSSDPAFRGYCTTSESYERRISKIERARN